MIMGTQYTAKDHVDAVFGKGQTDRIPVRAMQTFRSIMGLIDISGKEIQTEPDKYVKALVKLWEVAPSDVLGILVGDPVLFGEIAGLSFEELKALGFEKSLIEDKSALKKMVLRDAKDYKRLQYYVEICKRACEALPHVVMDTVTVSPWSTAMMMRGIEAMIYDTADDPDFVHELLNFTTDLAKMIGDALLETGVGMVTMGDPSAGCSVISPTMFREWAKPYLQETVNHFKHQNKAHIFLHICGFTDPIMEDLVSLGIDGLSIDAPASLEKLVDVSKSRIVIEGNFPGELYVDGTKEQIEEKVKESVETASEGNGYRYILCSGCQVPDNAPLENVQYFLEAGQRYGHRPSAS